MGKLMQFYCDGVYYHGIIHQNRKKLPSLLLLHGFMGNQTVFNELIPKLFAFCNPITLDLLGHGKSICNPDPTRFQADRQISELHSILDRLQRDPIFVYGYSMGGRLVFQLITSRPDRFSGAFIESSHCGILEKAERTERMQLDEVRAQQIETDFTAFIKEWVKLPLFSSSEKQQESHLQELKKQNPRLMAVSLRGFGAGVMPPVCKKLEEMYMPLYLAAGRKDQKYVKRMSEISDSLRNASFEIVQDAGHRIHADQPDKLVHLLKTFIENHHGKLENC